MQFYFEGLTQREKEIVNKAYAQAKEMIAHALEREKTLAPPLMGDDYFTPTQHFLRWFKRVDSREIVLKTLRNMLFFLNSDKFITIQKIATHPEDGETFHGRSRGRTLDLPPIFFDKQGFKRQADILIHEISHIAADTQHMELEPRAGDSRDSIEQDEYGHLLSPRVTRPDKYCRYHAEQLSAAKASTCAYSYEFYIKDMQSQVPQPDFDADESAHGSDSDESVHDSGSDESDQGEGGYRPLNASSG